MKKLILPAAIIFSLVLHSCSSLKEAGNNALLEENTWILRSMDGTSVKLDKGKEITLRFESTTGSISGFGGCNNYFGKYKLNKDSLTITGVGSTEMACDDMNTETEYYRQLQNTGKFKIVSNTLSFLISGSVILKFEKK
jgi:heat shock protein HslJ